MIRVAARAAPIAQADVSDCTCGDEREAALFTQNQLSALLRIDELLAA